MASRDTSERGSGVQSTGELHAVLASSDRRAVLRYFRDREDHVASLDDLAGCLVSVEGGPDDPAEAATVLHHRTLPTLADSGAVDYDPRTKVTRYRGHERLEALLPPPPNA
jgi:hypothetical protein